MKDFIPTFLYIKEHPITGLKYFGKTTGTEKYLLEEYLGSGDYWEDHLRIHGKQVDTPWYCLYTEKEELTKFALMCSEQWDIVKAKDTITGKKVWANLRPENGLNGTIKGSKMSDEHRINTSKGSIGISRNKGRKQSEEEKKTRSKSNAGKKNKLGKTGHIQSPEHIANRIKTRTGLKHRAHKNYKPQEKVECPYCSKKGSEGNMKRYHFDNCKRKLNNDN